MLVSILWPKIFVEIFLLLYYLSVAKLKNIKSLRPFLYIIALLLIRDLFYTFLPNPLVMTGSDVLVVSILVVWLRTYTGSRMGDNVYFGINALILLFAVVNEFIQLVTVVPFYLFLWLAANVIYLFAVLSPISVFNTENPQIIIKTRSTLVIALLALSFIVLLVGYQRPFTHLVIIPLSYLIYAYLLYNYYSSFVLGEQSSYTYLSNDLESLFDFMKNLGQAIAEKIDLNRIMELIVSSTVRNINADAGAILMIDEFEDVLRVRATEGDFPPLYPVADIVKTRSAAMKSHLMATPIKLGDTVLGKAAQSGQPIYIRNAMQDERLEHNHAQDIMFISSIIVVPLVVTNRVLGVLAVIKRKRDQFFDERDLNHIRTFADYTSMTIDNILTYMELLEKREMEREIGIAAEIQQKLLPGKMPELSNASLASFSVPAKGVSGDYFDIISLGQDKVAVVICDVAGKGVPAALVMVMIRSILHLIASAERESATILTWINRGITGRIQIDHFATLGFFIFNQKTREVIYSNAAHLPMLLYKRETGKLLQVDTEGLPIGIERDSKYGQKRFTLNKDDILILYTDGITEAMNTEGKQYSYESLTEVIAQNANLSSEQLVEKIRQDVEHFVGNAKQHDDQTLLLMRAS